MNRAAHPTMCRYPERQHGVVLVMLVVSLLVLIAMAGLALDGAHMMINNTRLQNVVDAAALSAAKTLDQTNSDTLAAEVEARAMFLVNATNAGNGEIGYAYTNGDLNVDVEFSNTLIPFVPGTAPASYVRVIATNLRLPTWLLPVMGVNELIVEASAVAGPSVSLGYTCNIAPMMLCADPGADPLDDWYGYTPEEIHVLKAGSPNEVMVKGNFQLVRLDGDQGAADIRRAMAGSYDACLSTSEEEPIQTEPGNTVGPVAQGLNTRFGIYSGPMGGTEELYPADDNVTQSDGELTYVEEPNNSDNWEVRYEGTVVLEVGDADIYDYAEYKMDGGSGRRVIAMPVGECGDEAGVSEIPYLGTLCFFLLQQVAQGPNPDVFGEFVEGCEVNGTAGPLPITGPGPYVIQLYKDPDRVDS